MSNKLPPIGIMPHRIWIEHRIIDLMSAIERYIRCGKIADPCVIKWIDELKDLYINYE